ncbi:hypothetical protein [Salipiger abyssi]|uniref:hypothetical protein n=1 Tax=Salipiger abyssi TaxID=1250539 RepID=UPI001A8CFD41|nr:hypothetical protein [Salipiger abyssi]MBN9889841.1 hypothetical protein [Salipiger abyssi]
MGNKRRIFMGLALAAPALAARAQTAASGALRAFPSRAALVAQGGQAGPGELLTDGRVSYRAAPGAGAIPDLAGLLPFGAVSALHWGVVPDDRAAAAENARRLNLAAEYCRGAGTALHLPAGSLFIADRLDFGGLHVLGRGVGQVLHTPVYFSRRAQHPAPSQIVMTGTDFTPLRLHGISSMKACGAARRPEARREGLADASWELVSLMNADATTGAATPADLVVGIVVEGGSGARLEGFRVVADSGGPHGLDGYNDRTANRIIGGCDIGILQIGAANTTLVDVQTVGHFRRYGYLNVAIDADGDYSDYTAPYATTLIRCDFQGMRGFGLRGPDKFVILDWTPDSVDLPWADDHPFTLDPGHNRIRVTQKGTGTVGGRHYAYSGVAKVTVSGEARIRLSGLSGFDPGRFAAVVPTVAGGGNSHIVLRDCQIGGLTVPSGHLANDRSAVANPIVNGAIGGFEISGWRCAEPDIQGRLQHSGTVAGFIHDCREVTLDLLCEADPARGHGRGMTWIVSPQHNQNRHAAHPAGGNRWLEWRYGMITERSSNNVDYAPFMDFLPRPEALAGTGRGWFEGYWALRSPHIRFYTRKDGTDANYLPVPALAVGPGGEGFRGRPPEDPLHIRGGTDRGTAVSAALTLSERDRSLRLFLDAARERGLVLREERDGALWDVLRSVLDAQGPALRVGGGLQVAGTLQAEGGLGFPPVPAEALADAAHAVNAMGKSAGKAVFDSSNGRCLVASGSAPEAPWNLFDGTPAVRPA